MNYLQEPYTFLFVCNHIGVRGQPTIIVLIIQSFKNKSTYYVYLRNVFILTITDEF